MTLQRSTLRYDVQLDIEFTVGDESYRGSTRNVSLGGVFINSDFRPPFNSRVMLRFWIPGQKAPIEVGGVARWAEPVGFGVQLDGLLAHDVWALGKFFEQL
jgi:hypothetical protein